MTERKTGGKYHDWIKPEGLIRIEGWSRDGLTDAQIAHNIGIAESTLYKWKNDHVEISEVLKRGKDVPDRQVENALFNSAIGFEYTEETVTNAGDVVEVVKYSKPNTTAAIFWLKNRKQKEWRDRQEIDQTNRNVEINVGEWDED